MPQPMQFDVDPAQLKLDPDKPTVLIVSDSAAIHSGFAQVVRGIFKRIWKKKCWNIVQFGWWHAMAKEKAPWPIITTRRHPSDPTHVDLSDKYGELSFEHVVGSIKPDVVWVMGDPWMITPTLQNAHRNSYHHILYVPVDGAPLMKSWGIIANADTIVPYLPWGKKMIERWVPKAIPKLTDFIPHGVDTAFYAPQDESVRVSVRQQLNLKSDDFLAIAVGRNQARKNIPALVELTYYIRSGDYQVCKNCGRAYRNPYDYAMGTPSGRKVFCQDPTCWIVRPDGERIEAIAPEMIPGTPHPNFYAYLHTPLDDIKELSWKITDLLDAFPLGMPDEKDPAQLRYPGFRWNQALQPVHGVPEADLRNLYAASDIFVLPTTGEGFGLPILEAMACGTPVVVPNVSSHPDFIGGEGGIMVDIGYHVCEILSSYYRGYPDMDDYLTKILLLMEDQQLRAKLSRMARLKATKYDWDTIAEQWFELISSRIGESRATKRWHKLTQV